MIVVIPVYSGDIDAVQRNLEWCLRIDKKAPFKAIISTESGCDIDAILSLAKNYFADVEVFRYLAWTGSKQWPIPHNYAWRQIAKHMPQLRSHWLWWESDAVPIKAQWLQTLEDEYQRQKKPFMGVWTTYAGYSYMAGVGLYPEDIYPYCPQVLAHITDSFDIVLGMRIGRSFFNTKLIQHRIESVTFTNRDDVDNIISENCVLFHKCKDGSLISALQVNPVSEVVVNPANGEAMDDAEISHKTITFRMALDNIYGLGQYCCGLALTLIARGYDIRILPLNANGPFQQVPSTLVSRIVNKPIGRLVTISVTTSPPIGSEPWYTLWESSLPRSEWVRSMQKSELVILPCKWNMDCFSAAGVNASKIVQVPLGIDTNFYVASPMQSGPFTFGTGGRICHGGPRKRLNQVISAFKDAFPKEKDVRLLVKCFPDDQIEPEQDKRIRIIQKVSTAEDMAAWYRQIHCFVTATSGEGWGLMPHTAMACGRPVIAPVHGGLAEFFDARVGLPVDHILVPAEGPYQGLGLWARVNQASLIEQMQYAYAHPEEMQELGRKASARAKTFNLEASATAFTAVLPTPVKSRARIATAATNTFYHAGDLGDTLYSLPTIKRLGGGVLYLGPNVNLLPGLRPRVGITRKQFDFLAPLLREQPYISDVIYSDSVPNVDYDLNIFRYYWRTNAISDWLRQNGHTHTPSLMWIHLGAFKVNDWSDETPWLRVEKAEPPKPVVIHRSARYNNPNFPWSKIKNTFPGKLLFVGLKEEHKAWCNSYGVIDFYQVRDALEMARLIAGSKLFIGNQSFPYAIAEGMKHTTIQETWNNGPNGSDCIFDRSNAVFYRTGVLVMPDVKI